jgi:hypothetical protein
MEADVLQGSQVPAKDGSVFIVDRDHRLVQVVGHGVVGAESAVVEFVLATGAICRKTFGAESGAEEVAA